MHRIGVIIRIYAIGGAKMMFVFVGGVVSVLNRIPVLFLL